MILIIKSPYWLTKESCKNAGPYCDARMGVHGTAFFLSFKVKLITKIDQYLAAQVRMNFYPSPGLSPAMLFNDAYSTGRGKSPKTQVYFLGLQSRLVT